MDIFNAGKCLARGSPVTLGDKKHVTIRILRPAEAHEFSFDAREFWNASDCVLERGGRYRLDVVAETEPWVDGWLRSTPNGGWPWWARVGDWYARRTSRAPKLPMYVLVGAVDRDPATYFPALGANNWTALREGVFELFANDWSTRYENNKGRLLLRLSRT